MCFLCGGRGQSAAALRTDGEQQNGSPKQTDPEDGAPRFVLEALQLQVPTGTSAALQLPQQRCLCRVTELRAAPGHKAAHRADLTQRGNPQSTDLCCAGPRNRSQEKRDCGSERTAGAAQRFGLERGMEMADRRCSHSQQHNPSGAGQPSGSARLLSCPILPLGASC